MIRARPITLRPIAPTDVAAMDAALAEMESAFLPTYPWFADWLGGVRSHLLEGSRVLYVIDLENDAIGAFLVNCSDPLALKANAMVIKPEYRGRGYSTAAYHALFELYDPHVRFVFTQCKTDNSVARRLIEGVGFREIGRLRHLVEASDDNLVFVREPGGRSPEGEMLAKARELYSVPGIKELIPTVEGHRADS